MPSIDRETNNISRVSSENKATEPRQLAFNHLNRPSSCFLQQDLVRVLFLYIFISKVRSSGVRASSFVLSTFENPKNVAKYRSIMILFRIAKRFLAETFNLIKSLLSLGKANER